MGESVQSQTDSQDDGVSGRTGLFLPQELEEAVTTAYSQAQESGEKLKAVESALQEKKELQRQVLAYAKTKPARDGLRAQKTEKCPRRIPQRP